MRKLIRNVFMSAILLSTSVQAGVHVFGITNKDFVGDCNQILGVQESFRTLHSEEPDSVDIRSFDYKDLQPLVTAINEVEKSDHSGKVIVLGVSDYGADAISQLKGSVNKPTVSYTMLSHQITPKVETVVGVADFIALPAHAVTPEFKNKVSSTQTKLIETVGVSHNLKKSDIQADYDKFKDKLLSLGKYNSVMVAVLGGDAPDGKNLMKYYTPEEAKTLANYLGKQAILKNAIVLATNGPRTGKHNQETGKVDDTAHKNGKFDFVSQEFVDTLKSILPETQFAFYDFQSGQPSMSKAMYGQALKENGVVYIPGESTSMVSEAVDNFGPTRVIVYKNKAMNPTHLKHVELEQESDRIKLLDEKFEEVPTAKKSEAPVTDSASMTIAKKVLQGK